MQDYLCLFVTGIIYKDTSEIKDITAKLILQTYHVSWKAIFFVIVHGNELPCTAT